MGRQLTDDEVIMMEVNLCFQAFFRRGFENVDLERCRVWKIWAARHQTCPRCDAPPNSTCLNLADIRRAQKYEDITVRPVKHPHEERIDWSRLLEGLKSRGYWRQSIRRAVEAEMRRRA